jgi:hypothetical protein
MPLDETRPVTTAGQVNAAAWRAQLTVPQLEQLLKDAKTAHEEFERVNGPDVDDKGESRWPAWYALYIMKRVNNGDVPWKGCR